MQRKTERKIETFAPCGKTHQTVVEKVEKANKTNKIRFRLDKPHLSTLSVDRIKILY